MRFPGSNFSISSPVNPTSATLSIVSIFSHLSILVLSGSIDVKPTILSPTFRINCVSGFFSRTLYLQLGTAGLLFFSGEKTELANFTKSNSSSLLAANYEHMTTEELLVEKEIFTSLASVASSAWQTGIAHNIEKIEEVIKERETSSTQSQQ